ncbi:MAG: class I SAM-dependent methyltransferase [Gaiellaceae bacterium]
MSLADGWERNASEWASLVRSGGDRLYERNLVAFRELLPPPGRLTVDVGCGEGRLARELRVGGHPVVGVDASETLVALAREADPDDDYRVADAAALPFAEGEADLVISFMVLMDLEDLDGALREAARVLEPGGRLVASLVHPLATAGDYAGHRASFLVDHPYLEERRLQFPLGASESTTVHRPLSRYVIALAEAGFVVERLHELTARPDALVPFFLLLRARR